MLSKRQLLQMLATPLLREARFGVDLPLPSVAPNSGRNTDRKSRRFALCVGSSKYNHFANLTTPVPDAALVAASLRAIGFSATVLTDPTAEQLLWALAKFQASLDGIDTALVYLAGHGTFVEDQAVYLASPPVQQLLGSASYAFPESVFLKAMSDQPRNKILVMDCCRDQIAKRALDLPDIDVHAGAFVLYAAQPGYPAYDGTGRNGPFAQAFVRHALDENRTLDEIARLVRIDVINQTQGAQIPWSKSSMLTSLKLNAVRA